MASKTSCNGKDWIGFSLALDPLYVGLMSSCLGFPFQTALVPKQGTYVVKVGKQVVCFVLKVSAVLVTTSHQVMMVNYGIQTGVAWYLRLQRWNASRQPVEQRTRNKESWLVVSHKDQCCWTSPGENLRCNCGHTGGAACSVEVKDAW